MVSYCKKKPIEPNVTSAAQNVTLAEPNVTNGEPNVTNEKEQDICTQCGVVFSCKSALKKHTPRCKGVANSLECHRCHKVLACRNSKYMHLQTCVQDLVAIKPSEDKPAPSQVTNQNAQTINNAKDMTVQNAENMVNNTNNINIIVFPKPGESMEFLSDHIANDVLRKIVNSTNDKEIFANYTRCLMENPTNQCVKKTNMRGVISSVHVGNNEWEARHDSEVFPKLVSEVANCFQAFLYGKKDTARLQKRTFDHLIKFMDFISDQGYTSDTSQEKEMRANFRNLVQISKVITHENTKKQPKV